MLARGDDRITMGAYMFKRGDGHTRGNEYTRGMNTSEDRHTRGANIHS